MNRIGCIQFDFQMQNESFARELYSRWDLFFSKHIESVTDEVVGRYDNSAEILEITGLELDLGCVEEEDFEYRFPLIFREKLEEALLKQLSYTNKEIKRTTTDRYSFELLTYFLLHGTFPWYTDGNSENIHTLFLEVLQHSGSQFKQFLLSYGHYTSLQERLVYQFNDPELEKGIRLLQPEEGDFIKSYAEMLRRKYKKIRRPIIRENDFRNSIWFVIYAYLLQNRGSYFNRKNFIGQTILQLAAKYNISYDRLLHLITADSEQRTPLFPTAPELWKILNQLRNELTEKQLKDSFSQGTKLYKMLFSILQKEIDKGITKDGKTELARILSRPDSCRLFLQQLTEKEITGLIPILIPSENDLIVETSKALDNQKEKGYLQGKAGGEFRLIKWQILFSVLLDKDTSSFNRKHFIKSVIHKISAHYNTEPVALLDYICADPDIADKNILKIFYLLREEMKLPDKTDQPNKTAQEKDLSGLIRQLQQQIPLSELQQQQLHNKLRDNYFRHLLLEKINETEQTGLISVLFPENKESILSYAQQLELLREVNYIQGKTSGNFTRIKWDFLFSVLGELNDKAFNKEYFISSTLYKIAGRYNTTYFDLLSYFRQDRISVRLPYQLQTILNKLYTKESSLLIKSIRNTNEADQNKSRSIFYPSLPATSDPKMMQQVLSEMTLSDFIRDYLPFHSDQAPTKEKEQIVRLYEQTDFIRYAAPLFQLIPKVYEFFTVHLKKKLPGTTLFDFLLYLSTVYKTVSQQDLLIRFIHRIGQLIPSNHQSALNKKWKEWSEQHRVLAVVLQNNKLDNSINNSINHLQKNNKMENENSKFENDPVFYLNQAGIVLIAPFLPRLFEMLHLVRQREWENKEAQKRACGILQYIIFGKEEDTPEHEMVLNKVLAGLSIEEPIPSRWELTQEERETTNSMLEGAKAHWDKLKNTSVEALRQAFLQRPGKLEEKEEYYLLTMEEKPYDMLLDSVPWNFKMIRFPWMKKRIEVKWR